MKLSLAEPKYLKDSVSIISDLVNEARFKISSNAIELVAMDPANVAMVVFKLLSSAFTEYDVKKDVELAINLSNLKQILRRAGPNDMLSLELEENKLKIQLKGHSTRTFGLPIIDIEEKEQNVPELKFNATVQLASNMLNSAVEDADIVADSVSFSAKPKKFVISAEGDLSHASIEIKEGDNVKINVGGSEKVRSKYSVEYLKKMIAASKLADDVTIQFSNDYPLKLEYKTLDKLSLSFILAPRVENE